ncbi:MAG TPA: molybdopterin molybdotransferase MoeA [Flavisolibacter sp.]|nr:molybdopterin molybdotransferase MoeA [Flavisolibacter sp.]
MSQPISTLSTDKKIISVEEAEIIILSQKRDFGTETVSFRDATGRILAQDIIADRDLPPFNRVAMDGIAIHYQAFEKGIRTFRIGATQAAGEEPKNIEAIDECIEIMTGAALPLTTDTIIRYEDLELEKGKAILQTEDVKEGQNIHWKGSDKKKNEVLVPATCTITPAVIGVAASTGASELVVKKLPKIAVLSTGDELVEIEEKPSPYQIRNSNAYYIEAVLRQHALHPVLLHLQDDEKMIQQKLKQTLAENDVLILTGGVSMGKFDYVPKVLKQLSVQLLFYRVQQRPGKPFWFGSYEQKLIFAFPGNPVSAFLCLHRYFLPWLNNNLHTSKTVYAILDQDVEFKPSLTYFLQVKLNVNEEGKVLAHPIKGNGSGDFSSLTEAGAFIELPSDKQFFKRGEVYKIWPVNKAFL